MTTKKILPFSLAITIAHFVLTLVIGHYLAVQVGSQMGQVAASGISDISKQKTEAETNEIYQKMKNNGNEIIGDWKVTNFLLSLPMRFLLAPSYKKIQNANLNNALNNEISKEQFYTRRKIIDYSANLVNSFCLGPLIYFVLRLSLRNKT